MPRPVEPSRPAVPAGGLDAVHHRISTWYAANARDLPWRRADCSPWGVMVSEFMLQQTPVVRVLPVWKEWMERWPEPGHLASEPAGEALRAWGRLGYPRRALRLHAAAQRIVEDHGGLVPSSHADLLALPGIGSYTAAAIGSFAFGRPETVVDTNIRRVHARLVSGRALPEPSYTASEARLAEALMPAAGNDGGDLANAWNASVMELGALVCTARAPRCGECPVADACAWVAAGRPEPHYVPKGQPWAGTDRQVRGAMMGVLRACDSPVPRGLLLGGVDLSFPAPDAAHVGASALPGGTEAETAWKRLSELPAAAQQRERSLVGLLADGLAHEGPSGVALPH